MNTTLKSYFDFSNDFVRKAIRFEYCTIQLEKWLIMSTTNEEGRYSVKINSSRTNITNCSFLHNETEFEIIENILFELCFDLRSKIRMSSTVISNLKQTLQFSYFQKTIISQTKYRNTPNFLIKSIFNNGKDIPSFKNKNYN